jgi:hypothetical protein
MRTAWATVSVAIRKIMLAGRSGANSANQVVTVAVKLMLANIRSGSTGWRARCSAAMNRRRAARCSEQGQHFGGGPSGLRAAQQRRRDELKLRPDHGRVQHEGNSGAERDQLTMDEVDEPSGTEISESPTAVIAIIDPNLMPSTRSWANWSSQRAAVFGEGPPPPRPAARVRYPAPGYPS